MSSIETVTEGPLRVLHVMGSLKTGGAETWLVQLADHLDRRRVRLDVAVNCAADTPYARKLQQLGCRIHTCPSLANPLAYMGGFLRILKENGPYDVVHSHLHLFSGLVMRAAHVAGVPVRIAHSRNWSDGKRLTLPRRAYRTLMRHWIGRYSTALLAISRTAALGAFGRKLGDAAHCRISVTSVDLSPFTRTVDRAEVRRRLGIPQQAKVVGHVGSFRRQKNHCFLLDIAKSVAAQREEVVFLLVGDGPLRQSMEDRVGREGLAGHVRFLGERDDVAPLMLGAMDCFLFPSLYEGLGRVLVEAQAAGLPCVASSTIDGEVAAYPGAVRFMDPNESPETWASEVITTLDARREPGRGKAAMDSFAARGFTPEANARLLTTLYEGGAAS
jgi:glycosyltransferase involved in cell wall biosynthesis